MTRKLAILLVLTIAAAFFGFTLVASAADTKAAAKKEAQMKVEAAAAAAARHTGERFLKESGEETSGSLDLPRGAVAPIISQSVSPYILMHTGVREADNNGAWKRHAVLEGEGSPCSPNCKTLHVLYPVFDGIAATNNRNQYNILRCASPTSTVMQQASGSEFRANPPQADQNGAIAVTEGDSDVARAVWVGRGNGGNLGTVISVNADAFSGLITTCVTITQPADPARPLEPEVRVTSAAGASNIAVFVGNFNFNGSIGVTTSAGGCAGPWTPQVPAIVSSFLNCTTPDNQSSSNPLVLYVFSMGLPGDSTVGNDVEEIIYAKSLDGGVTWGPTLKVCTENELPSYQPLFINITSLMVGDTAHVFWADRAPSATVLPGGHIHHAAVYPSGATECPPTKVADINLFFDQTKDNSTTGFGLAFGIWGNVTCTYDECNKIMTVLWTSPPEDPAFPGLMADTTDPTVTAGRTFPNHDIWCAASGTNGRNWAAKHNVTMTDHPNCNGTTLPCEHEFYISAADDALPDTSKENIFCVAQVQKFPGFQALGDPGPQTRLADEWRLYKIRCPLEKTLSCGLDQGPPPVNLSALGIVPGGSKLVNFKIRNTGLADMRVIAINFSGGLNGCGLVTTGSVAPPFDVAQLASTPITVNFNAAGISSAGTGCSGPGLRSGCIQVTVIALQPVVGPETVTCQLCADIYVVPNLCLNSSDTIHSLTNFTEIWSHSVEVFAASINGMFFFATSENYIFDGGKAICIPSLAGPPLHPRGLRNYFSDNFLRCLTPIVKDSIPDPTDPLNSYEITCKTLSTGLFDSNLVWETIWEQSTNAAYSDFLCITNKVINISDADIPDVVLGHTNDIDVPTGMSRVDNGMTGPANLSWDTTFTSSCDGKQYRMLVLSGVDTTGQSNPDTTQPHFCTPDRHYFGVLAIPNGAASTSPVQARGAVIHNNRTLVLGNTWVDSIFCRNLDATGYHTGRSGLGDPYTGLDTIYRLDKCLTSFGQPVNNAGVDIGYNIGVKKVTMPVNNAAKALVSRGGLSALAASIDTLTLDGPQESYTIILVASLNGLPQLMEAADSAISYCECIKGNVQAGGDICTFHRGDVNNDGILTAADVVLELNAVFAGNLKDVPACVCDLNLDGILTAADVVKLLNYVFLCTLPDPAVYPACPELMCCFGF